MKGFLRKIAEKEFDDSVHDEFIKFSKGKFDNRYLIQAKKQAKGYAVKTSAEFSNFLVRSCLEKISGEVDVEGVVIATFDLSEIINFELEKVKKYMGIQQAVIKTKVSVDELKKLMDENPRVFFGISFKGSDFDLKVKKKAPKSGKPSSKGDEPPKADFCTLKTNDAELIEELLFDVQEFKEVHVQHSIEVKNIEIPSGIEDPKEMREKAIRSGTITRMVDVDGVKRSENYEFKA